MLIQYGYKVVAASHGKEGLEIFKEMGELAWKKCFVLTPAPMC